MTERSKKNKEIKKIIIINIKYYLNYIIERKSICKCNCERNKIVEEDW